MQALTAMAGQKLFDHALKKVESKLSKPSASKQRRRKNPRYKKKNESKRVSSISETLAQDVVRMRPQEFRNKRLGRNFATGMSAPVSYDSVVSNFEEMFAPKKISHPEYGAGSVVAFSSIVANVGSNAIVANADRTIPFEIASITDPALASGFLTTDGKFTSGLTLNPALFGTRMFTESGNWGLWRPRRLQFKFQTASATTIPGVLAMTLSRDQSNFVEANAFVSTTSPTPSIPVLTQTVPNSMANLYRDCIVEVSKFPAKPYFVNYAANSQFGGSSWNRGNNLGSVAYYDERSCGRIVGLTNTTINTPTNFGYLWCEGEIEFYQPTTAFLAIGSTYTAGTFSRLGPIDYRCLMLNGTSEFRSLIELCSVIPDYTKRYHKLLLMYLELAKHNRELEHEYKRDFLAMIKKLNLPPLAATKTYSESLRMGVLPVIQQVQDEKSSWTSYGRKPGSTKGYGTNPSSDDSFQEVELQEGYLVRGLDPGDPSVR